MKLRNLGLAAAALAVPTGMVLATSGLAGAATTFPFKGSATGTISGTVTFTPAITLATPYNGPEKIVTSGTLTGLSGNTTESNNGGSTTISGGTFHSTVNFTASNFDCTALASNPSLPTAAGTAKWTSTVTGTGLPAANSIITFGSEMVSINSSTGVITATLGGTGTTTKGSFAKPTGANSNATLVLDQTENQLLARCSSATGLKSLSFKGVHGPSSFTAG
jgi:hypothetical protein